MNDLDRFTTDQLRILHAQACRDAVDGYEHATGILRMQAQVGFTPEDEEFHGELDAARRQVFAAADEQYEHARAISAELTRRDHARA